MKYRQRAVWWVVGMGILVSSYFVVQHSVEIQRYFDTTSYETVQQSLGKPLTKDEIYSAIGTNTWILHVLLKSNGEKIWPVKDHEPILKVGEDRSIKIEICSYDFSVTDEYVLENGAINFISPTTARKFVGCKPDTISKLEMQYFYPSIGKQAQVYRADDKLTIYFLDTNSLMIFI